MTRTKSEILHNILEQLHWDSRVDANDVKVEVNERGQALLKGYVPTHFARQAAVTKTALVPGVTAVDNQLKLHYSDEPSDDEIRKNILKMLEWNPDIDVADVKVSANRGWVTLEGSVDAYWKKTQADLIAYNQIGVYDVKNKITVVPSGDETDEVIADSIIKNIDRSAVIDMNDIDISVEDQVVTLRGTAPNWRAYRTIYDIIKFTMGVRDIEDEMNVTSAF